MRPALVIQNNRDNSRLLNTIVVQITSVTRRALEPTQLLIELDTPAGQQSGLRQDFRGELCQSTYARQG